MLNQNTYFFVNLVMLCDLHVTVDYSYILTFYKNNFFEVIDILIRTLKTQNKFFVGSLYFLYTI